MTITTLGIPPTILESVFEDLPEPEPAKTLENRNYDIKIEVTLKKGKGKLPGQASLKKTIATMILAFRSGKYDVTTWTTLRSYGSMSQEYFL